MAAGRGVPTAIVVGRIREGTGETTVQRLLTQDTHAAERSSVRTPRSIAMADSLLLFAIALWVVVSPLALLASR